MDEGTSRGWMVPRQRNNIAPVTISFKSGEESKSSSIVALNRGENSIVPCTGEPFAYHDDTYVTLGVS